MEHGGDREAAVHAGAEGEHGGEIGEDEEGGEKGQMLWWWIFLCGGKGGG